MRYFVCIILFFFSFSAFSQNWLQLGADIDGEASGDRSGHSVSSSSDGTIVAIGAPYNNAVMHDPGHVRVYKYENNTWTQLGADIDGGYPVGNNLGWSVSLSSDGTILAVGAKGHDGNKGTVRVYQYANNTWTKLGSDIDGEAQGDEFGFSVSLSSDGTILAVGAKGHDASKGHVRVYQWNGSAWTKRGDDIDGEVADDRSGVAVSLSSDGTILAIGAFRNDGNGDMSGHVRVYEWNGSAWVQKGADIDGEGAFDESGYSVSLSNDGTVLAVGAYRNDGNSGLLGNSGHVRVYKYENNTWTQLGADIDGEGPDDYFGHSVSINNDGTKVAIGARNANTGHTGHTRVYKYTNNTWTQLGADINGEGASDESGYSVSFSSDGTILAVGARQHDGNKGHVRVYQYQTTPITVKQDGTGNFTTITAAVDAAGDGSTIIVSPGTYTENIAIEDKSITLKSTDGPATTIVKPNTNSVPILWLKGSLDKHSTIQGFTLKDAGNQSWGDPRGSALKINNSASATVINVIFADADQQPFASTSNSNTPTKLYNCIFYGTKRGQTMFGSDGDNIVEFYNCVFANNAQAGIEYTNPNYNPVVKNCIFYNNDLEGTGKKDVFGSVDISYSMYDGGSGTNLSLDPKFVDPANNDFKLKDISPAIGSGTSSGIHATDILGNARPNPNGSNPDMGAYENALGVKSPPPSVTLTTSSATQFSETGGSAKIVASTSTTALENVTVNLGFTGTAASSDYVYENFSSEGLMLYMPFNGNANDESGNGNNGILHGNINLTEDKFGVANKAYRFDGINDHIAIPYSQTMAIEDDITMSMWIYFDSNGQNSHVISGPGANPKTYYMRTNYMMNNTEIFFYFVGSGQGWDFNWGDNFYTDQWHHITYTNKGDSARVYHNGQLKKTQKILFDQNHPIFTSGSIFIGSQDSQNDFFKGKLDEIRFYNRALSTTEISDLYSLQFPLNSNLAGSPNNNIVIKSGTSSSNLSIRPISDSMDEDSETIIIDVLGVTNGTESGAQQLTFTITDDDDPPDVMLSLSSDKIPEEAGETVTVTATLANASSKDVEITLAASGTATGAGTDYTLSSNTITIAAGQTTGTATVTAVADQTADDAETIILDISAVTNATEATAQQVTITISEDVCGMTGGSNLTGVIDSDKKLYKTCSPYTVTGSLLIQSGATLTIDNGVILDVNAKLVQIKGNLVIKPGAKLINMGTLSVDTGKLDAQGTVTDSIEFNNHSTVPGALILKNGSLIKYAKIDVRIISLYTSEISNSRIISTSQKFDLRENSSIKYNKIHDMGEISSTDASNNNPNIIYGNEIFDRRGTSTGAQTYVLMLHGPTLVKYNRIYETKTNVQNIYAIRFKSDMVQIENNIIGGEKGVHGTVGIMFDCHGSCDVKIKNNKIGGYTMDNVWPAANFQINSTYGSNPTFKYNSFIGEMNLSAGNRNVDIKSSCCSQDNFAIDMKENYWGNVAASDINNSITDYEDDFQLKGNVDFSNALTTPHSGTPISSVKNLKITRLASSTSLTWDANTETDLAGYKLHYGALTNGSYAAVLDLGNVISKTLNVGLGVTDGITVTAYDADADGTDDQIEGHESWFAEAEVISAPIGVNDSYQIAAGSSLDMTNGPFAHYQFDGDIKDITGNGYDLIWGNPTVPDQYFVNDRFDKEKKALKLSIGSSQGYFHPDDDAFNFKGQNEWTIYFWMKIDKRELNYTNGILSKSNGSDGWSFKNNNFNDIVNIVTAPWYRNYSGIEFFWKAGHINPLGDIYLSYYFNEELTENEWNAYTPKWNQVAVTYNGSEASMYFDGIKVASDFGDIPDISIYHNPLKIGDYGGGNSLLSGNMDDIRFYNRALSALEIQEMYSAVIDQSFAGVLANDTDLDGDTLTATLVQTTTNGTLTLQDNGKFKYVPNASYSGNDNFIYKAYDGTYSSANTTASISVSTPPTAANDSYSLNEGAALIVDAVAGVLSNDTDAESDVLTAVKLTEPTNGTLTFNADGSFTYTHDGGASTSDSFTYKANDGIGNSNTATVTFTIVTSDDVPVANSDAYGTQENEILVVSDVEGVLANDTDEEGDAMTAILVTDVQLGALDFSSTGGFTYQPPLNQKGIDTFEYKVQAGNLFSNTTYATININQRPIIAANQTFNVDENKPNGYAIGLISVDDESSSFTWEILSGNQDNIFSIESNGTIKVNNTGALNYEKVQQATLSVRANDGSMWSDAVDVVININNVQDMAIISSEVTHSYCSSGTGTGAITLVVEGQEGNLEVSWSSGQTTLSITDLASGTYTVTLSDDANQNVVENYTINQLPIFEMTAVCYVSSDSADYTKNRVFVKTGDDFYNVDKYKIWREGSSAGTYDLIGEINAETDDNFLDTTSDNRSRSYKYRVSMVDKCGVEAQQSAEHTTHHLVANQGISGEINLNWSKYLGLDFGTYEIFRKKDTSPFEKIGAVSSENLSFSDYNVSDQSSYKYYVGVLAEIECRPEGGVNIYVGEDSDDFGIGQGGKKTRSLRSNTFELGALVNTPPSIGDQTFSIAEHSSNGTTVGTIVATDADNDPLTFAITGGSGETTFGVDNTGKLTVKNNTKLDYETNTSLKLDVKVSDGSSDASAEMTINITDEDENTVTGIEDVASQIFNVYPIPTQKKLKVVLKDNVEVERIEFIDYSGKVIAPKHSKRKENVLTLDVSNLYSGIYILNLVTEKGASKARVVIER